MRPSISAGTAKRLFLIFRCDRSWRGLIDGKRFEWGAEAITGYVLKVAGPRRSRDARCMAGIAGMSPTRLIADDEQVSLSFAGVERFRTDLLYRVCVSRT